LSLSLENYYRIVDDLRNKLPSCTALHIGDGKADVWMCVYVIDLVTFTGNLHFTITSDSEIDINSYVLEWTGKLIVSSDFNVYKSN